MLCLLWRKRSFWRIYAKLCPLTCEGYFSSSSCLFLTLADFTFVLSTCWSIGLSCSSFLTLRWWLAQLLHLNVQTCGVTLHSYLLHAIWIKILVIQRGLRLLLIQFSFLLVNRLRLFLVNLKYLNYCLSNQASVPGISATESLTDLRNHVGLLLLFSYLVKYTQCDVLLAKKAPWNCFCDVLKMTSID